jgi:allantoinase
MDNELYDYTPITDRPPLVFPEGKTLAFYLGLNIERFRVDLPFAGSPYPPPNPMAYGWRDYGTRVGIWRMIDLFDEVGIRASGIINSEVCTIYPQIIEAGIERNWAWIAHGQTNSIMHTTFEPGEEEAFLKEMFATLDASLPARPRGWLGPGLTETFATPQLLADAGFTYLLDWCADDQPFKLNVPGLISVPYSLDVNDISMHMSRAFNGPEYEQAVMDHFEVLLEESATSSKVMALPLHTFIVGQPYRFKYFAKVIRQIASAKEVWLCTSDDIADHYLSTVGLDAAAT